MINEIVVSNLTTNETIVIGKEFGNAYLLEDDGLNWGEADAIHSKYTNLTGIGNIITSTKVDTRNISVTGRVCSIHTMRQISALYGVTTLKDINAKRLEEIESAKNKLSKVINPTHYIRIKCGDFYIDGKPKASIKYSNREKENNEIYCKFTFDLDCSDPMFHYKDVLEVPLSGVYGGFHFPLVISRADKMHFGTMMSYQLIPVKNIGDVAIGAIVHIEATGVVTNPRIYSIYTNEEIRVNKTLYAGEIVDIDTNERTIVGYESQGAQPESYFPYWDFDNSWIQFVVGTSLLGYGADSGVQNMDITIKVNPSYFAVEKQ